MATHNVTLNIYVGGFNSPVTGPTVSSGDSITLTVTGSGVSNGDTATKSGTSGCTAIDVTIGTATANAVTSFSGSSYSVTYSTTVAGTATHTRTLTGTVSTTLTAPVVDNTQTFATTASSSTSCDITLASDGSGGTLQHNKSTSTTVPTSGWQSSSIVTGLTRGTAYYLWARRGVGYEDRTNSALTVPYLPPAGGTPGSPNIFTGETSHPASISGGSSGTVYEFRSGSYTGTILNTVNGNGTVTCSGGAGTYYVTRYKTTGTGGEDPAGRVNLTTYTVTALSKQTFTITVNYIPGETGTPPSFQPPTVTVDVGSITGSVTSSTNPLEVSVGDDVIWKSGNNQDAVKITSLNDFTNNNDITLNNYTGVTRTLAAGVNSTDVIDIEIDAGGNGSSTTAYRIERVGGITSPSGLSASLNGTESQTEDITLSLSTSGSGGTLEYIQRTSPSLLGAPPSAWQTSNQFTQPRNTTRYYYASRNRLDGASTSVLTVIVNYLGAVTTGYSFDTASGNIGYGDGAPAISFTAAQANHTVAIFEGSTARSSGVTGTTDHNNIATNQIPPAGGSNTYNLRTYRNYDAGGNSSPTYVATTASTITIKRSPQTPSGLTTFTDGGTASASGTFTVAVGALDGASSTTITLSSNYTTNAVANGSAIASVARAGDIIYARNTGSNGLTAQAAISTPATFLNPKLDVTATNDSISNTATSASTTIGGMTAGETVAVRINNGTTNLATRVGNGARSFTGSLPTFGNSTVYELFISRPTTTGGSAAFVETNVLFTVTRAAANSAPTAFDFTNQSDVPLTSSRTSANTVTIAGLSTGTSLSVSVSGGTYSKNGGSYSSANTTTVNGDTFKLGHTSSGSFSTSTTTTLTVGTGTGSFVTTTVAQDTSPNEFTLQNITNAGLSTVYQSVATQVTEITGTVTVSVSGDGNPQVKIGNGAWTSGPTTITNNDYINARLTSSASNATEHTATVTVGTYSEDFTVTTVAASTGGSTGTSGGSGAYGIEVYDTNGTTKVLSPSTRYLTFMTLPATITIAAGATALVQQDMTGLTTSNCDIAFRGYGALFFTISRVTTGAVSSQGFSLYNHGTASATASPYIVRF